MMIERSCKMSTSFAKQPMLLMVATLILAVAVTADRKNFHRHGPHQHPQHGDHGDSSQASPPVDDFSYDFALNGDVNVYPQNGDQLTISRPYPICSSLQVFLVISDQPQEFLLSTSASGIDFSCFSHAVKSPPSSLNSVFCAEVPDYSMTLTVLDIATSNPVVDHVPLEQLLNGSLHELILQRSTPATIKITFTQPSALQCPSYLVLGTSVAQITPPSDLGASAPLVVRSDPKVFSAGTESYFYLANMDGGNLDPAAVDATFIPEGQECSQLDQASDSGSVSFVTGTVDTDETTGDVFVAATFPESGPFTLCIKDQSSSLHVPVAGVTVFGGNPAFFRVTGILVAGLPILVTFDGSGLNARDDAVKFIDYFNSCADPNAAVVSSAKASKLFGAGGFLAVLAQGRTFVEVIFTQPGTVRVCYKVAGSDGFVEVPFLNTLDDTAQSYVNRQGSTGSSGSAASSNEDWSSNGPSSSGGDEDWSSSSNDQSSYGSWQSSGPNSGGDEDWSSSSSDQSSYGSWQSSSGWGGSFIGSSSTGASGSSAASSNIDAPSAQPFSQCPRCPSSFLSTFGMNYVLVTFEPGQSVPTNFAASIASLLCINASFVVVTQQQQQPQHNARYPSALGASGVVALVVVQCDQSCNSHERLATLLWLFQSNQAAPLGSIISSMAATPAAGFCVTTASSSDIPQTLLVAAIGAAVGVAATIAVVACCFMKRCCCFKRYRIISPESRHSPNMQHGTTEEMQKQEIVVGIVVTHEPDGSVAYNVQKPSDEQVEEGRVLREGLTVEEVAVRPQYHDDGMSNFDTVQ